MLNFCIDDVLKNYVIVDVLFGCGQGVVYVPELDSGKLAPMKNRGETSSKIKQKKQYSINLQFAAVTVVQR